MSWAREKQAAEVVPPVLTQVAAVNCSTTVQVVDLTTLPGTVVQAGNQPSQNPSNAYVRITADGGNVYYATGSNFTTLNAIPNTVVFCTVNTTTGALSALANNVSVIPSGAWVDFIVMPGQGGSGGAAALGNAKPGYGKDSPCRYVALLSASGNPVARIHQSST